MKKSIVFNLGINIPKTEKGLAAVLATILALSYALNQVNLSLVTASPETAEVAPLTIIKVLDTELSGATYMAHFISDELVMVTNHHGDASLDGNYISCYGTVYVYKFEDGAWKQIKSLIGAGTWRTSDWSLVHDKSGYFSGDSEWLLEDMYTGAYETDAKVVNLETGATRSINFTNLPSTDFYPCQISYDGTYIAAGTLSGDIYVWKWNGEIYKLIFSYHIGGEVRRLHMTLDGMYLIAGSTTVTTLYIFKREGDTYSVLSTVELNDGVGALGISDPWNIGLIAVGGYTGWVHVINATDPANPVLIYSGKHSDNRFYNPFYDRWMPKNVAVLAFKDTGTVGVVYDIYANTTITVTEEGSAAAVSPSGTWVFLGDSIYMVIQRDPQSGNPRIRFWGTYHFDRFGHDLSQPIILSTPENRDWHAYFFGGTITVSKLFTQSIPTTLTDDKDILEGKLGRLYERGLVYHVPIAEISGYVDIEKTSLETYEDPEKNFDMEHTVLYTTTHVVQALYGWDGHGFSGSTVSSGVVIDVPLGTPVDVYSEIKLHQSMTISTAAPVFNWQNELLGFFGITIPTGAASYAFAKKGAEMAASALLSKVQNWWTVDVLRWDSLKAKLLQKLGTASVKGVASALGKAAGIAGIALIADQALGIYYDYVTYSSVRTILIVAPIVLDTSTGTKYSAVTFVLPTEEIQDYASEYEAHLEGIMSNFGIDDVGVVWISWGKDWNEYNSFLAAGRLPTIDLKSAIETTIASKHDIPLSRLKITGVKLIVEVTVHGKTSLWQFITGGIKVPLSVIVSGANIQPRGIIAGGRVITDPTTIANTLGTVTVNGVEYSFTPGTDGAIASFSIPLGAESITLSFARRGYFADISIEGSIVVKKDFTALGDFGYEVSLHYDWEDTLIRLSRVELVDMEYPMLLVERTFVFQYGNYTHDMTPAFTLNSTTEDPNSPSGYRYTYVTIKDTKYIDPANGGIMQPCKTYVFRYFYKQPPDAELLLYLNGTQVTSTKARHATVVLKSSAEQDVQYSITFRVKRFKGLTEETLLEESDSGSLHVPTNGTAYKTYLIEKYVDHAIQVMAVNGTPAFVEIDAEITDAPYNYIKENDRKTVIYYPPGTLVGLYEQPAGLQVYVYDAFSGSAIEGATVKVYNDTTTYEQTTNSSGWASFDVKVGLWNIEVNKTGYHTYSTQLFVYNNMTFNVALVPEEAEISPGVTPPVNGTSPNYPPVVYNNETYWWLSVQVLWNDGMPFHGALVTVKNLTDGNILFQQETNGTGFVHFLILNGTPVRVEVNATNPLNATQTFYAYKDVNMTQHFYFPFRLNWTSEYYEAEVMLAGLKVVIHRGQGYFFGNVSHLVELQLWTNTPQTVTVNVTLVNADTNATIGSKLLTLTLDEGWNWNWTWFDVNASSGMHVRAYANITSFEADTNLDNNELWSDTVFLKPFVDLHVFVIWKPVTQKTDVALLPEDIIELDIGLYTPINTTSLPARLHYKIQNYDLERKNWNVTADTTEEIRAVEPGIAWRNITLALPWSNILTVLVDADHDWEDMYLNNQINITIEIDPDVAIIKVEVGGIAGWVREGTQYKLKFYLRSNIPEEKGAKGFISVYDNSTETLGGRIAVTLKPYAEYELTAIAPENPSALWVFKYPFKTHTMTAMFAGYDMYDGNNSKTFTMTVYSLQLLWIIAAIIIIAIVMAILRAFLHTAEYVREHYKFVKRKRSGYTALKHKTTDAGEENRFVRRKKQT